MLLLAEVANLSQTEIPEMKNVQYQTHIGFKIESLNLVLICCWMDYKRIGSFLCEPQDWLKGLSWHSRKRHFASFRNGFIPVNRVTVCMPMQCVHLNSDTMLLQTADWICCKNIILLKPWFSEMVTSTDSNLGSSVLLQLKKIIAYSVVLQLY